MKEFQKHPDAFETKVLVTAQHREILHQVLDFFEIKLDYDLDLMKTGQNLYGLTADIITHLKPVLDGFKPVYVFVHGDTTTTMAGSIVSFYSCANVCHVEVGLRTHNKLSPFPEEINRQIIGRVCDFHFAPTLTSKNNLLAENIKDNAILVAGNTVIDALLESVERVNQAPSELIYEFSQTIGDKEMILVTGHRSENHGYSFIRICEALKAIALDNSERLIIYPVHLNPKVQEPVKRILGVIPNVVLTNPITYPDFIWMMNRSKIIIMDSGGGTGRSPSLGKPVLVMRDTTERLEAVEAGTEILVGTDKDLITGIEVLVCISLIGFLV